MSKNFESSPILDNSVSLDLHGNTFEVAELAVNAFIRQAISQKVNKVRIITGRGNHPNPDNRRGILFRTLPKWLTSFRPHIQHMTKELGAYEIFFTYHDEDLALKLTKPIKSPKTRKKIPSEYKNNPFMLAIAKNESLENISAMLKKGRNFLQKTCSDGTTLLMVAAAANRIDVMEFLLQQDHLRNVPPVFLKQTTNDGMTVLMKAIQNKHIDAMHFLLKKAPSLLKRKTKDDTSCFQIAAQTDAPGLMLKELEKHLKHHKRERGYTGLFREYKILTHMLKEDNYHKRKIPIFKKPTKGVHRWFFMDRMITFLKKHARSNNSLKKYLIDINLFKNSKGIGQKTRSSFAALLKQDPIMRRLFLRFNNSQKPVPARKFKHAIAIRPRRTETSIKLSKQTSLKNNKSISKKPVLSNIRASLAPAHQSNSVTPTLLFSKQGQNLNILTANQKPLKKKPKKMKKNKICRMG